ncbi:MAG: hypothetical protein MUE41_11365, partial [Gemmatimonadaceae bacterium]|nr:hypothetical protein [Gemmatimonadaceae bacterium]
LVPWRNPVWAQFVIHKLARLLTPLLVTILGVSTALLVPIGIAALPTVATRVTATLVLALLALLVLRDRRAAALVRWGWAMLGASSAALRNGMRGQWSVWR